MFVVEGKSVEMDPILGPRLCDQDLSPSEAVQFNCVLTSKAWERRWLPREWGMGGSG